jgi:Fe-S cluster assembly iron-binding protein IscA
MNISAEAIQALKEQLSSEDLKQKTIRFFGSQGCCGPSVQMGLVEQVPATDQTFCIDEVNFAIEPAVKEQLEPVTLTSGPQGFKLEGFQSSSCC